MTRSGLAIPVGVNLGSIGVDAAWWLDSAERVEEAGFDAVLIWDHFVSRGRLDDPVLECWSMLAAAAARTHGIALGSFVTNVMNRHPAVLARIVATTASVASGRIELGIGIGGHPAEHEAYGIPFPPTAERAEHLEEAIAILRRLFAGGPVDYEGHHYRLAGAHAFPRPDPPPRIIVGGQTPAGARLAARHGDAWNCFAHEYDALRPVFDEEREAAGRAGEDLDVVVGLEADAIGDDLGELAAAWSARGAGGLVIHDVRAAALDRVLAAMPSG